jgi:hypothetical protein
MTFNETRILAAAFAEYSFANVKLTGDLLASGQASHSSAPNTPREAFTF